MITLDQLRAKSPREFEEYIAKLLIKLGYTKVRLTSQSADSGYDIEAHKDNNIVLFECKCYSENNKVTSRDVRIFADTCRRLKAQKGIFITTSDFTKTVNEEQKERKVEIKFWNGKELLRQIMGSKNIEAYCISCRTPLKGHYKSYDWKENVYSRPRFPNLEDSLWMHIIYNQEGDLVPKNPRLCETCKYLYSNKAETRTKKKYARKERSERSDFTEAFLLYLKFFLILFLIPLIISLIIHLVEEILS